MRLSRRPVLTGGSTDREIAATQAPPRDPASERGATSPARDRSRRHGAARLGATVGRIRSIARFLAVAIGRVWCEIEVTRQILASRHQLRQLDDRTLRDVGISRVQADLESDRPAWNIEARESFRARCRARRR